MGLVILAGIDENFADHFYNWINNAPLIQKDSSNTIPQCLEYIFSLVDKKSIVEEEWMMNEC